MKNACPSCNGMKTAKAQSCRACRYRLRPVRLGTAKDWRLHVKTGYIAKFLNGKWTYQHRYVMEQHLGRALVTKEHVHHRNCDKTDNRLENLELISASDHGREHGTPERMKAASIKGHEARWGYKEVS